MNNIQFPEMNSITSSAGSDILETLNANILKAPEGITESILKNSSVPAPVLTHSNHPLNKVLNIQKSVPIQQIQQKSVPVQQNKPSTVPAQKPVQTKPLTVIPENTKSVTFDNKVQQKTISPVQKLTTQETGSVVPVEVEENTLVKKSVFSKLFGSATEDGVDHLLKVGNFKMPKKTLMLIILVALISGGLFYATRDKVPKKQKKKIDDDDDEN
jgi:hypothetical protein